MINGKTRVATLNQNKLLLSTLMSNQNSPQLLNCIVFDFGLYFKDPHSFLTYYSGLFFKVIVNDFNQNLVTKSKHKSTVSSFGKMLVDIKSKSQKQDQFQKELEEFKKKSENAPRNGTIKTRHQSEGDIIKNIGGIDKTKRIRNEAQYFNLAIGGRFDNLIAQN